MTLWSILKLMEYAMNSQLVILLNIMAECMNRALSEAARCMLHHANLSKKYWAEAVATAAYVRNRLSTASHKTM